MTWHINKKRIALYWVAKNKKKFFWFGLLQPKGVSRWALVLPFGFFKVEIKKLKE